MDEAAAAIEGDGAEKRPHDGDRATENNVSSSTEDTAARDGVFCCQHCGEAFTEEAAFLEHRHQHPQDGAYLDDQLDDLNDAAKNSPTTLFCTFCSLSFVQPSEFHAHMEKNHGQTSQKESHIPVNTGITKQHTYECPDCGKCYGVIGHFLNHQRLHRQASKSVFHDLEHLKKKSFQCESCGRNYSRASALDAHRRCHEGKLVKSRNKGSGDACHTEEPVVETKPSEKQTNDAPEKLFKCSCGKAFTALMRLKTHQRFSRNSQCTPEEMKEKPKKSCNEFYCSECKKSFNGHIALFNHQRWHANHAKDSVKRFPCEECGKVFMTLTFYYRHQRMVHSDETPAKSFLHQVCQLQKKAFECKDCGLKFSRASALHSHQLHHTDVFRETEKESQRRTSLLPQQKTLESETVETEQDRVESENVIPSYVAEEDAAANETDEDMESYEPGDFNVQVISASESEDEPIQDLNPDLELLCESDQEAREDDDTVASPGSTVSKPQMDLKIVQIDFEQCAPIAREAENKTPEERFDCPECYRWFSSASSLRVHRMWHGVRKRRQQTQGQSVTVYTCDTCGHETSSHAAHCSHIEQHDENTSNDAMYEAEALERQNLTCNECGKCFSRLSALVSHQLHHPKRKQFQCPDCMMSYSNAASLFNHMKNCSAQKKENISLIKKEYNPKKTLLGPKIYHCEQCGKGFWSLGAYSHHKQSQTQCADLRLRKGLTGSLHSVNGHQRSSVKVACPVCGRKFRHKGIMALHMRKHENGNHKCELCNRSFRLFSSLLRHQVVHNDQLLPPPVKSFQHQVEQLKKNTYSCPDCGKLFSRAKALQFHMKSHGYETGYSPSSPRSTDLLEGLQCATCLAHFNSKASLRAHQKLCIKRDSQADCKTEPSDENETLKDEDDGDVSTYESSENIAVHAEVNELDSGVGNLENPDSAADLKYKCNKCDRSFSVVGALNFHKRIHTEGQKSLEKAKLSMSVMLKKPKQEESSKGLFHCSECGRRFMSNSALGSHKRWHKEKKFSRSLLKDDDVKSVGHKTEGGPFQCHRCGKQFFNLCVLQRHQTFNPQCQTKTGPVPDSKMAAERRESAHPECNKTLGQGSYLTAHCKNEHGNALDAAHHQGDGLTLVDRDPEQVGSSSGSESTSTTLKPKAHQCPLCAMTFAKARGLRAHKWQAHSKRKKGKKNVPLHTKNEPVSPRGDVKKTEDSPAVDSTIVPEKNICIDRGKSIRPDGPPAKSVSRLDCVEQCSSAGSLPDHKKVKPESKQHIQFSETTAEVSPPLSRLSEHTAKCLFKCDKCGKAFQTEEQLGAHKTKARSRPYCCALCCHGFWTENQLQQHLAWHDEVRCRLPNEVRYRLSAAMTSKPLKPSIPSADSRDPQLSHSCKDCGLKFTNLDVFKTHLHQHALEDGDEEEEEEEEEEAAQMGDSGNPAAELDHGVNRCAGGTTSSSSQTQPSDSTQGVADSSADKIVYPCTVCGKTYVYLVPFRKHQRAHESKTPTINKSDENLKYECPDCGILFIRRAGLLGHLRVHKALKSKHPRCDQCNKTFSSEKQWITHIDRHKQRPFWCLSCAKGFMDERALDKHLQGHSRKEHTCSICHKSFLLATQLIHHYSTHTGANPYLCTFCGKSFSYAGTLISHRKRHLRGCFGSGGISLGMKRQVIKNNSKKYFLVRDKEEPETDKNIDKLPGMEEHREKSHPQKSWTDAMLEDHADSDESDCGDPAHHLTPSKRPHCGSVEPDGPKSGTDEPQGGQELDESDSEDTSMYEEEKDWEWECCECDMGFDEVAKLHLHYIKHATGELPIPYDES